jgi:hypothetical protein
MAGCAIEFGVVSPMIKWWAHIERRGLVDIAGWACGSTGERSSGDTSVRTVAGRGWGLWLCTAAQLRLPTTVNGPCDDYRCLDSCGRAKRAPTFDGFECRDSGRRTNHGVLCRPQLCAAVPGC